MRTAAKIIEEKCAGFIFHSPIDLNNIPPTNGFKTSLQHPKSMLDWCQENKT